MRLMAVLVSWEGALTRTRLRPLRIAFAADGTELPHVPGLAEAGGGIGVMRQSAARVVVLRGVVLDARKKSRQSMSGISHSKAEIGLAPMGRMRVF
jgi:hypothetical protein